MDKAAARRARRGRDLPVRVPFERGRRPLLAGQDARAREAAGRVPGDLRRRQLLHRAPGPRPRRPAARSSARQIALAQASSGIPLVATNDLHYTLEEDAKPHDVLLCIQQQKVQTDPKRLKFDSEEFYLKSARGDARGLRRAARGVRRDAARSPSGASSTSSTGTARRRAAVPPARSSRPRGGTDAEHYLRRSWTRGRRDRYGEA